MEREYYSIPEAAAMMGISRIAVFKRVKKGQMKAIRFGRNWAVPAAEISRVTVGAAALKADVGTAAAQLATAATQDAANAEMDSMGWD